ncbi:unnamed protein product [Rotaria sp. Silwood1]|nr:unnamed protein product [Rotaria sp. Silwood1]CAF1242511.1 unnamed protein product [Rotaria sp. Silwood1]
MYHINQHQHHLSWDNSIPPIITINSGEIVSFNCLDASNGQINAQSTDEVKLKLWKLDENNYQYAWFKQNQIRISHRPFTGECSVARSLNGSFSTILPYRTGENIDTKCLIKGAKLYLPMECKGALFSIGDEHAAQGDREVCGTTIETPIIVSVRLTVRHGDEFKHVTSPCLLTQPDIKQSTQYLFGF